MNARRLLLVALALLAGCKNTSTRPSLRLNGPSAVAVYKGFTTKDAANLRTYFAVANERGDDLRILDALDGQSVLAPALVQSLSVPTAPRPAMLAAGRLFDGKADLLAVASTGLVACDPGRPVLLSGCVEVLGSWEPETALSTSLRVVVEDAGGPDAAVLSLVVTPVPEPDPDVPGAWRAAPGRARVVAGLSGGRLLVAEYARGAPDAVDLHGDRIVKVGEAVHDLGFDPISLSASTDPRHVYAASLDPIGGVEGVAELDLSGPTGAAPGVRAILTSLPRSLPTTLVLAARVRPFLDLGADSKLDQHGPEVLRVYAVLDPRRCGPAAETPCGLAVLDPVAGGPIGDPATDPVTGLPSPELPAHAPIPFPGEGLAITAIYPPALGGLKEDGLTPATSAAEAAYQKQATATSTGYRWTSTLAAVASSNGAVYLLDLARGAPAMDRDLLASSTAGFQARVVGVTTSRPTTATDMDPYLGLWDTRVPPPPPPPTPTPPDPTPVLSRAADVMPLLTTMTPGYTPTETWSVTMEARLSGLVDVKAELQSKATLDGLAWLALQASSEATPGVAPFREVGRLHDPRLWLHVGDIAVVTPPTVGPCSGVPFELKVTRFLQPDPANYPGGAVEVEPNTVQPVTEDKVTGDPACVYAAGRSVATVTFLTGDLLVSGFSFGYAGRAPIAKTAEEAKATPGYVLDYHDTSALSCAPLDSPGWPQPGNDTCDDACRTACEEIYLSRKARRAFYLAEQCVTTGLVPDEECKARWGSAPVKSPRGPVLAFKVGLDHGSTPVEPLKDPARGTTLQVGTLSGLVATYRWPLTGTNAIGAMLPSGLATYDRSAESKLEASGVRVFVSYPSNQVLDFSPALPGAGSPVYK